MEYDNDRRSHRLRDVLATYVANNPGWAYRRDEHIWIDDLRKATEVGREIVDCIGFREVQLTGLLDSPDVLLIRKVVSWVLPYSSGQEFELLVAAVEHAARADLRHKRLAVVGWTVVACVVTAVFVSSWDA